MNSPSFEVYWEIIMLLKDFCVWSQFGAILEKSYKGSCLAPFSMCLQGKLKKLKSYSKKSKQNWLVFAKYNSILEGISGLISSPKASFSPVSHIIRDIYVQCCFDRNSWSRVYAATLISISLFPPSTLRLLTLYLLHFLNIKPFRMCDDKSYWFCWIEWTLEEILGFQGFHPRKYYGLCSQGDFWGFRQKLNKVGGKYPRVWSQ